MDKFRISAILWATGVSFWVVSVPVLKFQDGFHPGLLLFLVGISCISGAVYFAIRGIFSLFRDR